MKNKILCLDIETTGLDKLNDHIIQISYIIYDFDKNETLKEYNKIIKPLDEDFVVSDDSFAKHGLSKEFIIENGIDVKYAIQELVYDISNCDAILTYNGNTFDLAFISNYCKRYNIPFDIQQINCYDSYLIEQKLFPRTLEAVYKRYTGKELDGVHNAFFDAKATIEIFKKQLEMVDMGDCCSELLSTSGFVGYDKDKNIIFLNGKYNNRLVREIIATDPKYIDWMFKNVIQDELNTKKKIIEEYKKYKK